MMVLLHVVCVCVLIQTNELLKCTPVGNDWTPVFTAIARSAVWYTPVQTKQKPLTRLVTYVFSLSFIFVAHGPPSRFCFLLFLLRVYVRLHSCFSLVFSFSFPRLTTEAVK